jgi:phosphoribosyl-ATP pyrophosphohydrolase
MTEKLTEQLHALAETIASRKGGDPDQSYTARLLARGPAQAAKKFGEEAVELVVAATQGDTAAIAAESADVLYHWLVLLEACGVDADAVADALQRRRGRSGLEEKASRSPPSSAGEA